MTVGLNATGLAAGTYTANVCVHSNDATQPLVGVPVTLDVAPDDTIFCNGFD